MHLLGPSIPDVFRIQAEEDFLLHHELVLVSRLQRSNWIYAN